MQFSWLQAYGSALGEEEGIMDARRDFSEYL